MSSARQLIQAIDDRILVLATRENPPVRVKALASKMGIGLLFEPTDQTTRMKQLLESGGINVRGTVAERYLRLLAQDQLGYELRGPLNAIERLHRSQTSWGGLCIKITGDDEEPRSLYSAASYRKAFQTPLGQLLRSIDGLTEEPGNPSIELRGSLSENDSQARQQSLQAAKLDVAQNLKELLEGLSKDLARPERRAVKLHDSLSSFRLRWWEFLGGRPSLQDAMLGTSEVEKHLDVEFRVERAARDLVVLAVRDVMRIELSNRPKGPLHVITSSFNNGNAEANARSAFEACREVGISRRLVRECASEAYNLPPLGGFDDSIGLEMKPVEQTPTN